MTMDYIFNEWQERLSKFESSVKKDLEEIRKCKAEIQQIKQEAASEKECHYISDPKRLVLSAPEIIIGHVDQYGDMYEGSYSHVVIRGTQVDVHGVGRSGQVDTRANSIRQIAEDPGSDGNERVVYPSSEVVSQARNITLQSNDAEGFFSEEPGRTGGSGIRIHADQRLEISAQLSSEKRAERLSTLISQLKDRQADLEKQSLQHKLSFQTMIASMEKLLTEKKLLMVDDPLICTTYQDIGELNEQIEDLSLQLSIEVRNYADVIALLAETNRQVTCLNTENDSIKKGDDYKQKSTGASVAIAGEHIVLTSVDGDGNLRDNEGAGISMIANEVNVASIEGDGSLKKEGKVRINTKTVEVTTANNLDNDYDDNGELTSAKYPAEGDVIVRSKNITLESVDYEVADKELKAKELTKEGQILIRAEKAQMAATDIEEEAHNSISLDATEKTMQMVAEKTFIGEKDQSKQLEVTCEEISIGADKTFQMKQGDGKAVVQMESDKVSITGDEVNVKGKTKIDGDTEIDGDQKTSGNAEVDGNAEVKGDATINGNADIKGEAKSPKATIDNLEVKGSFKSRNIMD